MTPPEHTALQDALAAARRGAATLPTLATAHDIAARYHMTDTLAYIRDQIRHLIQGTTNGDSTAKTEIRSAAFRNIGFGVFVGIAAGISTHFILVAAGQRHVIGRKPPSSPHRPSRPQGAL